MTAASLCFPAVRRGLPLAIVGGLFVAGTPAGSLAHRDSFRPPTAHGRWPDGLYAIRDPHLFTHNVGLLTLQVTNLGILGNPFIEDVSAGWAGGEYLYYAAPWIGAVGEDREPHVSIGSPVNEESELRPDLSPVHTIYKSFEGMRDGLRIGGADPTAADDDGDGAIDEEFHNGLDDDGDGAVDEDFSAVGQQMFSCEYRDDTVEALQQATDHTPLGITVRQRTFQWSTADINEMVGIDLTIINSGDQRLEDVYLGFFTDADAGLREVDAYFSDDLAGWDRIDTTIVTEEGGGPCSVRNLSVDAAFLWDAPDNGTTIVGGDVPGVFGTLLLDHTTDLNGLTAPRTVEMTTVQWYSGSSPAGTPRTDEERYLLLSSGARPSRNAARPDDYRYVIAAGPYSMLNPGESLSLQLALVIGTGHSGFRKNAVSAKRVYDGTFIDVDDDPNTGVGGRELCLRVLEPGEEIIWDDPCDTLDMADPPWRSPECKWVDGDCDPCTGMEGREFPIRWVGTTTPPAPTLNTDPGLDPVTTPGFEAIVPPGGDRRVILQWNNLSELYVDPITGQAVFEGYRIWRADNWQRPTGSIGPAPEDWRLIDEFRLFPEDGLGFDSPHHLIRVTVRDVLPIDTTADMRSVYPVGRYRFEDTQGIINGRLHFYAVTAFGLVEVSDGDGGTRTVELSGLPTAVEAAAVVPRWDAVASGECDGIAVVPNPYRGGAAWDLIPADRDPTGTKIALRNLPQALATVRIYTLAGDLIISDRHDGRSGDGTYFWNLLTRNGQNIVSGIYLYSVEHPGGVCRGRFVVLQ